MKAKCKNAQRNKFIAKMINENRELGICSPFEYFGVRYEGCGKIGPYNPVGSRHYHKLKVVDSDGKRVWVRCGKYLKNDNLINNLLVKDEISKV
ncbi:hypothetical protein HDU92_007201 [Lobulomyces angularis]|nr:hypothetical protein HDU92_007201 [Lobulomyces angularis]